MLEEKIRKELFKKMVEWFKVYKELEDMESETGLSADEAFEQLVENNQRYQDLLEQSEKLREGIAYLITQTIYWPIFGLTEKQKEIKDIFREFVIEKEEHIEKILDEILTLRKDDMARRFSQLPPMDSTIHIPERIRRRYQQVTECYVNGTFEACCVLCRAIVESIAKKRIEDKDFGHLLSGKNKEGKLFTIPEILAKHLSMPAEILDLYRKISGKADIILHNINAQTTEDDALNSIKWLKFFIEKFPKMV